VPSERCSIEQQSIEYCGWACWSVDMVHAHHVNRPTQFFTQHDHHTENNLQVTGDFINPFLLINWFESQIMSYHNLHNNIRYECLFNFEYILLIPHTGRAVMTLHEHRPLQSF
jgi:hypothetical protein